MITRWKSLFIIAASAACGLASCDAGEASDPGWSTDVIGIKEMHLTAEHWAEMAKNPDEVLSNEQEIAVLTQEAFVNDQNMVDLANYPDELPGSDIADIILSISKPYHSELFFRDGGKVESADYDRYQARLNLAALSDVVPVRFGLILQRSNMRTWPTLDVVFKSQETVDLDRFQENGLFPADMVAVLHESKDGQWYFVQSFNYAAWVRKERVAVGPRADILAYKNAARFLIVTGS